MRASVIGATGFAGAELLRLLDGHPQAELAYITSESSTGEDIAYSRNVSAFARKNRQTAYFHE